MTITITDKALDKIRSIADKKKIKDVAVYLDMVKTCCSIMPLANVIEQLDAESEEIENVAGIPIYSCDSIKQILMKQGDIKAEINLLRLCGSDELTIRFCKNTV